MRVLFRWLLPWLVLAPHTAGQTAYTSRVIAGGGSGGDGAPAIDATLLQAQGLAFDASGNLYIADAADHRVRRVDRAGSIHTLASASGAGLRFPYGVAVSRTGVILVTDLGNGRVRRILPGGGIETAASGFLAPRNVAFAHDGGWYVSDFEAHRVYRVSPSGEVSVLAGAGAKGYSGDGGPALAARLSHPAGIAVDSEGSVYIADSGNHAVRKIRGGVISTLLTAATPAGLAIDVVDTLYVADPGSGQILRRTPDGRTGILRTQAADIAVRRDGAVLIARGHEVSELEPDGSTRLVAGSAQPSGENGPATGARLRSPTGLALDNLGNLYFSERTANRLRILTPAGSIHTVQNGNLAAPGGLAAAPDGGIYVADTGRHRIRRISRSGRITEIAGSGEAGFAGDNGPATAARLNAPEAVLLAPDGALWIADSGNGRIRVVDRDGRIRTALDSLIAPSGLIFDPQGALWIAETGRLRVLKVAISGTLEAVGGPLSATSLAFTPDGTPLAAGNGLWRWNGVLWEPIAVSGPSPKRISALVSAGDGSFYVTDSESDLVFHLAPKAADPPGAIAVLEVRNAATGAPGPVAPGMLISVPALAGAPNRGLFAGGTACEILDSARGIALIPNNIQINRVVVLELREGPEVRAMASVPVAEAAPGLFSNLGTASAVREDGMVISDQAPAIRGSVVAMFATGEGRSGLPVSVTIGGIDAEVLAAVPAPGFPGLFQVNIRVPGGFLTAGRHPVILRAGEHFSQPGVFLPVQ
ncbi:MAG: hypothetical protein K2X35_02770 [Bryobacteraceae bacterium]|nr:hypothetical protein [Bryobacteraceae bacterium]